MALEEWNVASLKALANGNQMLSSVENNANPYLKKLQNVFDCVKEGDDALPKEYGAGMQVFLTGLIGASHAEQEQGGAIKGYLKACDVTNAPGLTSATTLLDEARTYQEQDTEDKKKAALIEEAIVHEGLPIKEKSFFNALTIAGAVSGVAIGGGLQYFTEFVQRHEAAAAQEIRDNANDNCSVFIEPSTCLSYQDERAESYESSAEFLGHIANYALLTAGCLAGAFVAFRAYDACKDGQQRKKIEGHFSSANDSQTTLDYKYSAEYNADKISGRQTGVDLADVGVGSDDSNAARRCADAARTCFSAMFWPFRSRARVVDGEELGSAVEVPRLEQRRAVQGSARSYVLPVASSDGYIGR